MSIEVKFHMEPMSNCLANDVCVPAWATRVVSRNDQAFFHTTSIDVKIIIFKTGKEDLQFDVKYLGQADDKGDVKPSFFPLLEKILSSHADHVIRPVSVQCLVPVADIDSKVTRDVEDQKKSLEKNTAKLDCDCSETKIQSCQSKKGC